MFKKPKPIFESAKFSVFGDRYVVKADKEELVINFSDVTAVTALGKNKLNIYVGDMIYQFKGDCHFNPLVYMNVYYASLGASKKEGLDEPTCNQSRTANQFLGI